MNLTEFAEQIVFGTSLDEKLASPGRLSFAPATNRATQQALKSAGSLATPARPSGLKMHDGPGLSQPPNDTELGDEKARGRLLHFLANHELLATELMALVLLKFPDAPLAFRRGVLVTLQEEQEHTRLYLQRMQDCGIEFGSYPLSGHFWRVVEPMKGPIDFVSRLSLTFEQANLDYSLHYARLFSQLGDSETAAILERVYQDEIGHVQHGLHWFRQWKDPNQSDWTAYESQLEFPMSPQRARGPKCEFNREGRQAAGLDTQFIEAVEVYRQSRGRPPVVRWFDAAAEADLATCTGTKSNESNRNSRKLTEQLQRDLECLMVWLSKEDDVVLTRELPSQTFRKHLLELGTELPEFVKWSDREKLAVRKLEGLQPWAWTPANVEATENLQSNCTQYVSWCDDQLDLFRKSWAANQLHAWLSVDDLSFVPPTCAGKLVTSMEELFDAIEFYRDHGFDRLLFKNDLGTSGRGQRLLNARTLRDQPAELTWFDRALQQQAGIVEPELDRVVDLSFLFNQASDIESQQSQPEFLGWTRQRITTGRRYAGTYLRRPFADCSTEVKRFLLADDCRVLHRTKDWLLERLWPELRERRFVGQFGVDAMVCRMDDGLRIKPIVELNPRCTMGHIALRLQDRVAPTSTGEFRILRFEEYQNNRATMEANPIELGPDGRLKSGMALLAEPSDSSILVPLVVVGCRADHLTQ